MAKKETAKRSFFERLSGGLRMSDDEETVPEPNATRIQAHSEDGTDPWATGDEEAEGELAIDIYQTPTEIVVQTFVAGVRPEDLEINITRDMLTIRGKRKENTTVQDGDFFSRELYWGSFVRTISLPQEIEPEDAEAIERHGLLTIRMPKIDKNKKSQVKVKSV